MGSSNVQLSHLLVFTLMLLLSGPQWSEARTLILTNRCAFTIWPGVLGNPGSKSLINGGFKLAPGQSRDLAPPSHWGGRTWGRTGCKFDANNAGTCATGDCGRGLLCAGAGGIPPATLAEFKFDDQGKDYYDVSLVDGYNLPMTIVTTRGTGDCRNPGCTSDLNASCPQELAFVVNDARVGCKSACLAFNKDQYCCRNNYNTRDTCPPTRYSQIFKAACPSSYSYAYDDKASLVTCTGGAYEVIFCP